MLSRYFATVRLATMCPSCSNSLAILLSLNGFFLDSASTIFLISERIAVELETAPSVLLRALEKKYFNSNTPRADNRY